MLVNAAFIALIRALVCCALGLPCAAQAAALGEVRVRSALGQSLHAEIDIVALTAAEAESITVRLASPQAFADLGLDYASILRSLRLSVERGGGRHWVRVTSELPVSEPFVSLVVELNANGNRTLRHYAVLLDPLPIAESPVAGAPAREAPALPAPPVLTPVVKPAVPPRIAGSSMPTSPATAMHRVGPADTLFSIATAIRREGETVDQVLVALQRANPAAFAGKNINRVLTGSRLRLPSIEEVQAIGPAQARREVHRQRQDFQRTRLPAGQEAAHTSGSAHPLEGREAPAALQATAASADTDHEPRTTTPAASQETPVTTASASGVDNPHEQALAEAQARIATLEKSLSDMTRQLETHRRVTVAGASSAPLVPMDRAQPAQVWAAASEFVQHHAWSLFAAAALVLAGVLAWWAWRRRMNGVRWGARQRTEGVLCEDGTNDVAPDDGDALLNALQLSDPSSSAQQGQESGQRIADIDMLITGGRDDQAEARLLAALSIQPAHHELRLQLLEIVAARRDRASFARLALPLKPLSSDESEPWLRAKAMGRRIDPDNPLYADDLQFVGESSSDPPSAPLTLAPVATAAEFLASALVPSAPANAAASAPPARPSSAGAAVAAAFVPTTMPGQAPASPVDEFALGLEALLGERRMALHATAPPVTPVARTPDVARPEVELPVRQPLAADGSIDLAALQTKLELAVACQEIGDRDGARELLAEVARSPQADLAQRARSLLSQLA